jgi:hypothetical protein
VLDAAGRGLQDHHLRRPAPARLFFEALIADNLDLGRPENVEIIFGRRVRCDTPGTFRTAIDRPVIDPDDKGVVVNIFYKHSRVKQYLKEGRAMRRRGRSGSWAVEGAGGLGHLVAQQLVAAGERVLDVQPKLAARVRLLADEAVNKNDPNDARAVAVTALRSRTVREVLPDDHRAVLKMWSRRHHDLARNRTRIACRLHVSLCELIPGGGRWPPQVGCPEDGGNSRGVFDGSTATSSVEGISQLPQRGPVSRRGRRGRKSSRRRQYRSRRRRSPNAPKASCPASPLASIRLDGADSWPG